MYAVDGADAGEEGNGFGAAGEIFGTGVAGGERGAFGLWEVAGTAGYVEELVGLVVVADGGGGGDGVGNPF